MSPRKSNWGLAKDESKNLKKLFVGRYGGIRESTRELLITGQSYHHSHELKLSQWWTLLKEKLEEKEFAPLRVSGITGGDRGFTVET